MIDRPLHRTLATLLFAIAWAASGCASRGQNHPPPGFIALFDGESLEGWRGALPNPIEAKRMPADERTAAQAAADAEVAKHWRIEDGELISDGHEPNLATVRDFGDFELWIDWKILPGGDSGIYLRGSPQVQIWDPFTGDGAAKVGSGGLYNNQRHPSTPLVVADSL